MKSCLLLLLLACATAQAGESIGPTSELGISVKKRGALKAFAHDHELSAPIATGTFAWCREDPSRSSVSIRVRAKDIKVLDSELSEKDRAEVLANMRSSDVLDVERFPEITFSSDRVVELESEAGKHVYSVAGRLTLHGVTRQVSLKLTLEAKDKKLVVTGEHALRQTDYGIEPFSIAFGAVGVQDVVTIRIRVVSGESP